MKLARSDARILVYGLLADGLDVESLTPKGRKELNRAIDKILDLADVRGTEIIEDHATGRSAAD